MKGSESLARVLVFIFVFVLVLFVLQYVLFVGKGFTQFLMLGLLVASLAIAWWASLRWDRR